MTEEYQHVSIWSWSLERRLEYATERFEKTAEKYPRIAEAWLAEIESIERKIKQQKQGDR